MRMAGELIEAKQLALAQLNVEEIALELALIYLQMRTPSEAEQIARIYLKKEPYKVLIQMGIWVERSMLDAFVKGYEDAKFSEMPYLEAISNQFMLSVLEKKNAPYPELLNCIDRLLTSELSSTELVIKKITYLIEDHQYEAADRQLRKLIIKNPTHMEIAPLQSKLNERKRRFSNDASSAQVLDSAHNLKNPMLELDRFIGLEPVKKAVLELVKTIEFNNQRKLMLNLDASEGQGLNFIFSGNPGTGKTTIARILGGIFEQHHLLKKGHVIEVDRSGLVGEYIGQTESKTKDAIEKALDGILFIDEAYALSKGNAQNDFGKEAIEVILKAMEDNRERLCVIFAGYKNEMQTFLNANPGLRSRINFHIDFPDYTYEELLQIAEQMAKQKHYVIEASCTPILLEHIETEKVDESFGNARVVRNIIDDAIRRKATRLAGTNFTKEEAAILTPEDFGFMNYKSKERLMDEAISELTALIGLDALKKQIFDLKDYTFYQIKRKSLGFTASDISYHMTFEGNPGTGKTIVARVVGKIFKSLGILKRGHLIEASREDFVASYSGQTAEKTAKMVKKAYGGILFIDEAYALIQGENDAFGKEAVDTLIKYMEDDRDRLMIILAGYTDKIQMLLNNNPGFQSRINNRLSFEDYNAAELNAIFDRYVAQEKYTLDAHAIEAKEKIIQVLSDNRTQNFGNARSIRNLFEKVKLNQGTRFSRSGLKDTEITQIRFEDFGGIKDDFL